MKRIALTAGLAGFAMGFALATAGLPPRAGAQPRLEQTGDGYTLVYDGAAAARGNEAGGRDGRLVGGGEGAAVLYTGPDPSREGRWATLSGGGEDAAVSYAEPAKPAARRG
jgi:hypothetical protein